MKYVSMVAVLALALSSIGLTGCAVDTTDPTEEGKEEKTDSESSAYAPAQGGCSMGEIHQAQAVCGGSLIWCHHYAGYESSVSACSSGGYVYI